MSEAEAIEAPPIVFQCPLLTEKKGGKAPAPDPAMELALETFMRLEEALATTSETVSVKFGEMMRQLTTVHLASYEVQQRNETMKADLVAAMQMTTKVVEDAKIGAQAILQTEQAKARSTTMLAVLLTATLLVAGIFAGYEFGETAGASSVTRVQATTAP